MVSISAGEVPSLDPKKPLLIYVYADTCKACQAFSPEMASIASENLDVQIYRLNALENPSYMMDQSIAGLPFFALHLGPRRVGGDMGASRESVLKLVRAVRAMEGR